MRGEGGRGYLFTQYGICSHRDAQLPASLMLFKVSMARAQPDAATALATPPSSPLSGEDFPPEAPLPPQSGSLH
eukprot:scaffold28581_cov94-Isochrysis_galbana.AAC.1